MSLKGLGKAVARAPQSIKHRFNVGEQTSDAVYIDAERRFKELEKETEKLNNECRRYFNAVNGMLKHQIGFAKAMAEIFQPISGHALEVSSVAVEDNPDGIRASEQYRSLVSGLQEILKPDLELIEEKILQPTQQLLKIISSIRKMATKHNHKQLDFDRRLNTYHKYENKKERSIKDDEKMLKAEAELQVAQQEYEYYNDMLKTELPVLFQLESDFVRPLFVSFYYMQLNVFYTLYNAMQDMKIPYFDLSSDIVQRFQEKRAGVEEQADALSITHFRLGYSRAKLEMTKRRFAPSSSNSSLSPTPSGTQTYSHRSPPPSTSYSPSVAALPPYSAFAPSAPPASSPATTAAEPETCVALYEFAAQAPGDLSFPANALIEIVDRSDADGWWTGRYNGVQGLFPGNYVSLTKH